jgi:hypothetical protein
MKICEISHQDGTFFCFKIFSEMPFLCRMADKLTNAYRTALALSTLIINCQILIVFFLFPVTFRLLGSIRDHKIYRICVRNTLYHSKSCFLILLVEAVGAHLSLLHKVNLSEVAVVLFLLTWVTQLLNGVSMNGPALLV